jgi:hypothetical protein
MTPKLKRTLIVVGASTAIGFIGDVLTYSVAASKGGKFRIVSPRGKELVAVILLGIVGGFLIDSALKGIETSLKSKEEKALDKLVDGEKEKIFSGVFKDRTPSQVVWA